MINRLKNNWFGQNLPDEHIKIDGKDFQKGRYDEMILVCIKKWLFHPIKRKLARVYLKFLRNYFGMRVVGITGSAGKTTTKDMLSSILTQIGETVSSHKNIDPVYNIPMTIFKCRPSTHFLVLEFGVEYYGEMDYYTWLARPDVAVITNIAPTHTEFFGDEEGVFREKIKIANVLGRDDALIFNRSDKYFSKAKKRTRAKLLSFGNGGDVRAVRPPIITKDLKTQFSLKVGRKNDGTIKIKIPVFGKHFVENALAAACAAHVLGVGLKEIKSGLEKTKMQQHRNTIIRHESGAVIVDDSYNNNPKAATESIKNFSEHFGDVQKVLVFGDMLELGEKSRYFHEQIGRAIAKSGFNVLICVGKLSSATCEAYLNMGDKGRKQSYHVEDESKVDKTLQSYLEKNNAILIKGSRSVHLDKLVNRLIE